MSPPRVCNIRASLGLGSSSSETQWNRIQADAREILDRKGLLGKTAISTEVKEKKLGATKELERLYPAVFRRIPSSVHRENIIYDIYTLEMDKFRGKERLKSRDLQPGLHNASNNLGRIVVTINAPSVLPGFNSQLLRTDLTGADGNISIHKLHEVLQEDGLDHAKLKYTIKDEYGCSLSSTRHLQASFQRVANEGKLLTNWLISWDTVDTPALQLNSLLQTKTETPLLPIKSEAPTSPKLPPRLGSPIVFENDTSKQPKPSTLPRKNDPAIKTEKIISPPSYIVLDSDSDDYYLPASDSDTPLIKSYRTRNPSSKPRTSALEISPKKEIIESSSCLEYQPKGKFPLRRSKRNMLNRWMLRR